MDPILVLEGSGAQRAEFAAVLPAPSPADSTVCCESKGAQVISTKDVFSKRDMATFRRTLKITSFGLKSSALVEADSRRLVVATLAVRAPQQLSSVSWSRPSNSRVRRVDVQ